MKKIIMIVLMGCMMCTVAACGNNSEEQNGSTNTEIESGLLGSDKEEASNIELSMEALENAPETSLDEFRYTEFEGEVVIGQYIGDSEIVVIPDEINGCPVIKISRTAFRNNETVKAVKIGNSVKVIGDRAFINCTALEYVIFGSNVEEIEESCFLGCLELKEIRLNEGLETIGDLVFSEIEEPLVIPKSVTSIGSAAFSSNVQVYADSYAVEYMETYVATYEGVSYEIIE